MGARKPATRKSGKRVNASGRPLKPLKWHRELEAWLKRNDACATEQRLALAWALSYTTAQAAWMACRDRDWMEWATFHMDGPVHVYSGAPCWCRTVAGIRKNFPRLRFA